MAGGAGGEGEDASPTSEHRLYYFWSIWHIQLQRHPLERCLTNSEAEQR